MTFKEKLADDFTQGLLPPNRRNAKAGWLQGFKSAKVLILNELSGKLPVDLLDAIAELGEDITSSNH